MITKVSVWLNCSYRSEIRGFQVSAPVEWVKRDHENQILELPNHSLQCLLLLNDSNQWCTVQIYMAQKFLYQKLNMGQKLCLYYGGSLHKMPVSVIQKESPLGLNLWKLEVKPQNLVTCHVRDVCLWIAFLSYHHPLGRVCPGCPDWGIYFLFRCGKTWVMYLLKIEGQYKAKRWYVWKRSRFSWESRLWARIEEEIKF